MVSKHTETIRSLMEAVIHALVDFPEAVAVAAISSDSGTVLIVKSAPIDAGKIIGKEGMTVRFLRTLLSASSMKTGTT